MYLQHHPVTVFGMQNAVRPTAPSNQGREMGQILRRIIECRTVQLFGSASFPPVPFHSHCGAALRQVSAFSRLVTPSRSPMIVIDEADRII
jgi:hypothetical protein